MSNVTPCESIRNDLQAYLLETLPKGRHQVVHAHLDHCVDCQRAVEQEEVRLSKLWDAIPAEEPRPGLAERTIDRTSKAQEAPRRHRMSLIEGLCCVVIVGVLGALILPALSKPREASRRASSANNMKQWGLAFKMYANESEGNILPPLDPDAEGWTPDLSELLGEYVSDRQLVMSPSYPLDGAEQAVLDAPEADADALEAIMGNNYAYLGYPLKNEAEFAAVKMAKAEGRLEDTLQDPVLPRLREGIERFLISDINNSAASSTAQSTIPVLVEVTGWKLKKSTKAFKGANVLYLDGHVEFVAYGTFPVVDSVLNELSGLSR